MFYRKNSRSLIVVVAFMCIFIFAITNCSKDSFDKVENPNAEEYSKLKVDQEEKELEKLKRSKVKERRIYSKFTDNIVEGGGNEVLSETTRYNELGNKTEQYRYSSTAVNIQWLFDYDEYNNLKSVEEYDGLQQLLEKTYFNFKANGLLLDKREEKKNIKIYYEYDYDDSLNLVNVNLLDTDKRLYSKYLYKYKSNLLDSIIIYRNNRIAAFIILNYDNSGKRISETTLSDNNLSRITNFEYDNNGNLIKIINQRTTNMIYKYDSSGNVTEEKILDSSGNLQSKTTFEYNIDNELLTKKVRYDGLERPALTIKYEYDFY